MVAASEALDGLGSELWRAGTAELEEVMAEADRMVTAGESARVMVLAEATSRGETGSGALALTPVQWVRRHAPSTRAAALRRSWRWPRRSPSAVGRRSRMPYCPVGFPCVVPLW